MTDKRLLDPAAVNLLKAADLIDERGWWDGGNKTTTNLCTLTAIQTACCYNRAASDAAFVRLKQHIGCKKISEWNDHHDQETVVAAMRAAAAR
jgi:hypothetical protein